MDKHVTVGRPLLTRAGVGWRASTNPVIGADVAGTVVEVGDGAGLDVGDEVFGTARGACADFAVSRPGRLPWPWARP